MNAVIQGVEYEVRFRHTRLPGHDQRVMPTLADAFYLLTHASYIIDDPKIVRPYDNVGRNMDPLAGQIKAFQDAYIGASITKSHSTDCYILDADRSKPFERRLVSSGQTFCDKMDNFDRAEGRWVSFNVAIDAFPQAAQVEWLEWFVDSPMRKPRAIAQCAPQPCTRPVPGWHCTRGQHTGPCAAVPDEGCETFRRTRVSEPGAAITEYRIEIPASIKKAISDNIALGRKAGLVRDRFKPEAIADNLALGRQAAIATHARKSAGGLA